MLNPLSSIVSHVLPKIVEPQTDSSHAKAQDASAQDFAANAATPPDGTPVTRSSSLPPDSVVPANIARQLKLGAHDSKADGLTSLASGLFNLGKNAVDTAVHTGENLLDLGKDAVDTAVNTGKNVLGNVVNAEESLLDLGKSAVDTMTHAVENTLDIAVDAGKNAFNTVTDKISFEGIKENFIRPLIHRLLANPLAVALTRDGPVRDALIKAGIPLDKIFHLAGFDMDANGVYHARQDALQQYAGYNSIYDFAFDAGTSMDKDRFKFTYNGQDYVFWAWKGDYTNLGAGAELGFYTKSKLIPGQWDAATGLPFPMTMTLTDKDGNVIATYNPSDPQWWITSFNPAYQNVKADDLTASYTIDFSKDSSSLGMYEAFYEKYGNKNSLDYDPRWSFDTTAHTATFTF